MVSSSRLPNNSVNSGRQNRSTILEENDGSARSPQKFWDSGWCASLRWDSGACENLFDYVGTGETLDQFLLDFPAVERSKVITVREMARKALSTNARTA